MTTLQVGPLRAIKSIADCAHFARDGAIIDVDAGDYVADVAVWLQDGIFIRAVGGRVRLLARGAAAEGKGIWVIRGGRVWVEGFDFEGAQVASKNGAGIRFESGQLTVRNCRFTNNENGILTSNLRIPLIADSDSMLIADSIPRDGGHPLQVP